MNILAHRGLWKTPEEKNKMFSIERAFASGFGVETDLRDYDGTLVISHDIADAGCCRAEELFKFYRDSGSHSILALNVKADGIQILLKPLLEKYQIKKYFLFDMSIPELVVNARESLPFYTRHSDIENECVMYEKAKGVWLDSVYDKCWLTRDIIGRHLMNNKELCIVSPELHGYAYEPTWKMLKDNFYHESGLISLCTDEPNKAKEFFYA